MSEIPGPLVAVNPRAPFQHAPIAMPIAASSSSAWTTAKFLTPVSESTRSRSQWLAKASTREVEGVMGYQAATVAPAYTQPRAAAELPLTRIRSPAASLRRTRIPRGQSRCSRTQALPSSRACTLGAMRRSLPRNCSATSPVTVSNSMSRRAERAPT